MGMMLRRHYEEQTKAKAESAPVADKETKAEPKRQTKKTTKKKG